MSTSGFWPYKGRRDCPTRHARVLGDPAAPYRRGRRTLQRCHMRASYTSTIGQGACMPLTGSTPRSGVTGAGTAAASHSSLRNTAGCAPRGRSNVPHPARLCCESSKPTFPFPLVSFPYPTSISSELGARGTDDGSCRQLCSSLTSFPFDCVGHSKALCGDRKSTRLNSSHSGESRMPSSA